MSSKYPCFVFNPWIRGQPHVMGDRVTKSERTHTAHASARVLGKVNKLPTTSLG